MIFPIGVPCRTSLHCITALLLEQIQISGETRDTTTKKTARSVRSTQFLGSITGCCRRNSLFDEENHDHFSFGMTREREQLEG